jgi:hypothetical protein
MFHKPEEATTLKITTIVLDLAKNVIPPALGVIRL